MLTLVAEESDNQFIASGGAVSQADPSDTYAAYAPGKTKRDALDALRTLLKNWVDGRVG